MINCVSALFAIATIYRWCLPYAYNHYGCTANFMSDFIMMSYIFFGYCLCFKYAEGGEIIFYTLLFWIFFWLAWKSFKKDINEGLEKGNGLASALAQIMGMKEKSSEIGIGIALVFIIVGICLFANQFVPEQSSNPAYYSNNSTSTTKQNSTSTYQPDLTRYKDSMPFAGMDEMYINNTIVGPYTRKEERKGSTTYYWDIGKYTVLQVKVSDVIDYQYGDTYSKTVKLRDVVSEVRQYYLDIAWQQIGKSMPYRLHERKYEYKYLYLPRFGPYYDGKKVTEKDIRDGKYTGSSSSSKSSNSTSNNPDGYEEYDDFEDFYNDHSEDFDSYREAEEYYDAYY